MYDVSYKGSHAKIGRAVGYSSPNGNFYIVMNGDLLPGEYKTEGLAAKGFAKIVDKLGA